MSGGKKGKKTKGKTVPLNEFLGDITPAAIPKVKMSNWAESVEDDEDYGYVSRHKEPIVLPTAPRAARDTSINEENIPLSGPHVAYISNLPYDTEPEDIVAFLEGMNISNVRLPKDANKSKGYGYVTFEDRTSLIEALNMADTQLKGRRIRIELSNSNNEDRRGRMGRMGDQRQDYGDDAERTTGDWRSARAAVSDNMDDNNERGYRSRYGGMGRDRDDKDSGFDEARQSNWRDIPREKMATDRPRQSYNRAGPGEGERDWNRFADRNRGGPGREGSRDRNGSSFGPWRNNEDADREKERWNSLRSGPRDAPDDAPPRTAEPPKERPKLALQPRTKPLEQTPPVPAKEEGTQQEGSEDETPQIKPTPVPSVNIFGAAKPVDTAAREREIEERLAKSKEAAPVKEEGETEKRAPRETWSKRNGEERTRPTWRSNEDRYDRSGGRQPGTRPSDRNDHRDHRDYNKGDYRDSRRHNDNSGPISRGPAKTIDSRSPPDGAEKERKPTEEEELIRMPKAKDDQAPNFVASNKYSMLPDDVDPDNIED